MATRRSTPRRSTPRRWPALLLAVALAATGCRTTLGDGGERSGDFDPAKLRQWLEFVADRNTTGKDVDTMVRDFTTYCTKSLGSQRAAVREQYELSVQMNRPLTWWFIVQVLDQACPQRADQLLSGLPRG